jgi:predicted nucleotidyltransferase
VATDHPILASLIRRIIEEVHPLRIVLFGSAARGSATEESDADLLIVMKDGTHRRRTAQTLYRQLRGTRIPFDLLVTTPSDLERHRSNNGLIYSRILREGKEVYAA